MEESFAQEQWEQIDGDEDLRFYLEQILEEALREHDNDLYLLAAAEADAESEGEALHYHEQDQLTYYRGFRAGVLKVASLLKMEHVYEPGDLEGS